MKLTTRIVGVISSRCSPECPAARAASLNPQVLLEFEIG